MSPRCAERIGRQRCTLEYGHHGGHIVTDSRAPASEGTEPTQMDRPAWVATWDQFPLDPCPHCGMAAYGDSSSFSGWWVTCRGCRAKSAAFGSAAEAAEAWNRRALPVAPAAQEAGANVLPDADESMPDREAPEAIGQPVNRHGGNPVAVAPAGSIRQQNELMMERIRECAPRVLGALERRYRPEDEVDPVEIIEQVMREHFIGAELELDFSQFGDTV